jgi:hypothetical protein
LAFLCSCENSKNSNQTIDLRNLPIQAEYALDYFFDMQKIVQLETNDKVLLSANPAKIRMIEGFLYILEKNGQSGFPGLYVFDLDGKLVNHLDFQAEELPFDKINDFDVGKTSDELVLLDAFQSKLYYLNRHSLGLLREVTLPKTYVKLNRVGNLLALLPGKSTPSENGYFFELMNEENLSIESSYFSYENNSTGGFFLSHAFLNAGSTLTFWEAFNDTLYTFDYQRKEAYKTPIQFPNPLPMDIRAKNFEEKITLVTSPNFKSGSLFINNAHYNPRTGLTFFNYLEGGEGFLNYFGYGSTESLSKSYVLNGYRFNTIIQSVNDSIFYSILNMEDDTFNPKLILFSLKEE